MTVQLKQRIVGIIVLIFLGLIILPILFGHDPNTIKKEDRKTTTSHIELPREISASPNVDTTGWIPPSSVGTTSKNEPKILPPQNPVENKKMLPTRNENFEKIESQIIHTEKNVNYPAPIDQQVTEESSDDIKTPAVTKTTPQSHITPSLKEMAVKLDEPILTKPSTLPDDAQKWLIQLGSFSNKGNAENLVKQLKSNGFKAYSKAGVSGDGKEIIRVFVGPEVQKSKAQTDLRQLDKIYNLKGVMVKNNL